MTSVFVTVGMAPQPFDRLIAAIRSLAAEHDVFAQIGTSSVDPGCRHRRTISYPEVLDRISSTAVIITHAGNSVRLVQRAGKVPIAVARQSRLGEVGNDHQVEYLREEEQTGRVVAAWDLSALPELVRNHARTEQRLLVDRPAPHPVDPVQVRRLMDDLADRLVRRR